MGAIPQAVLLSRTGRTRGFVSLNVAMTVTGVELEVAVLIGKNNTKGLFISCSRQMITGGHQAGWTCCVPLARILGYVTA